VTRQPPATLNSAGALVSTAGDLRRFLGALFGGTLLPRPLLAEMQTPVATPPESRGLYIGYGLGLMELATPCGPVWGHRGRFQGYTTFAYASADGRRAVVVLINNGNASGGISDSMVVRLQRLIFAAYCP
jgi:D-alanyl-D-alanine carboxypeptidase